MIFHQQKKGTWSSSGHKPNLSAWLIFVRQQDCGNRTVCLSNDPELKILDNISREQASKPEVASGLIR